MRIAGNPRVIERAGEGQFDRALEELPSGPGVFLVHPSGGEPYPGKTAVLRRRLTRLLSRREGSSRMLNIRSLAERVEYWPVASKLEMNLVHYEVVRRVFPAKYREVLRLRLPFFVRLLSDNRFPRTHVTSRLSGGGLLTYGPFRSRAAADQFEHDALDLFQIRRCAEDLVPAADHPGCVYGEMNMCLRPCQLAVNDAEYRSEAERFAAFLRTGGRTLTEAAEHARDRLSAEMQFEDAAREHRRIERIREALKSGEDVARELRSLNGIVVLPSMEPESVLLLFLLSGAWSAANVFSVSPSAAAGVSMDHRLREMCSSLTAADLRQHEREDHLALFARWVYSSWRDGLWIPFESVERLPWRRLVSAISRTAASANAPSVQ